MRALKMEEYWGCRGSAYLTSREYGQEVGAVWGCVWDMGQYMGLYMGYLTFPAGNLRRKSALRLVVPKRKCGGEQRRRS